MPGRRSGDPVDDDRAGPFTRKLAGSPGAEGRRRWCR